MLVPTKDPNKKLYINSGLVLIICLSLIGGSGYYLQKQIKAKKYLNCQTDFKTQAEAQIKLEQGATYLDKNHDGIACNNLLINHER